MNPHVLQMAQILLSFGMIDMITMNLAYFWHHSKDKHANNPHSSHAIRRSGKSVGLDHHDNS